MHFLFYRRCRIKKYFGTDGIRGVVSSTFTPEFAMFVGECLGVHIRNSGEMGKVLVGRDTRMSGTMLECAFASGLCKMGVSVDFAGVIPSAGVCYLTQSMGYCYGVVITSSHNPPEYNGIKIFDKNGFKISESEESQLEKLFANINSKNYSIAQNFGKISFKKRLRFLYEDYLVKCTIVDLTGKYYLLDCANGAGAEVAKNVFTKLGACVKCFNTDSSGERINVKCGATYPTEISEKIIEEDFNLGFSLDGDADRLIVCLPSGKIVDGDDILCASALFLKEQNKLVGNCVVGTIMSNFGLERELERNNIRLIRTDVGDRNVVSCIEKNGYALGGEQSGHIIYYNELNSSDAILSAIKIAELEILKEKTLDKLVDGFLKCFQIKININVPEQSKNRILQNALLLSEIENCESLIAERGRIVVRGSGTEPLIRVMVEGEVESEVVEISKRLEGIIYELF